MKAILSAIRRAWQARTDIHLRLAVLDRNADGTFTIFSLAIWADGKEVA